MLKDFTVVVRNQKDIESRQQNGSTQRDIFAVPGRSGLGSLTNGEMNRGDERIAGESTGAFVAPVRSQPPAVRAVSGAEADAFLVGEKVDWRCYLRYGEKTPRLTVFG